MKMWKCISLAAAVLTANGTPAQDSGWVTVSALGEVSRYESQAEAEGRLLNEARTLAIQKATGYTVRSIETLSTSETTSRSTAKEATAEWFESYLNYSRFESAGRIVAEDRPIITTTDKEGKREIEVQLRARVALEQEMPDPGLNLNLRTSQPAYREGDTIRISAESTKPGRIYLFNMLSNGTCTLVWPNSIEADNRIAAGEVLHIPHSKNRYAMVAELPVDLDQSKKLQSSEILFGLLYLGDEQVFDPADAFRRKFSHADINNTILRIPRNMRYETMTSFRITETSR